MAELTKRFILTTESTWNGVADKTVYNNSIVFIKSLDDARKGVKIYTQGAEFNTELDSSEVKSIIDSYVTGAGNIKVEVFWVKDGNDVDENTEGATPELRISDKSTGTISDLYTLEDEKTAALNEDADDSQLVQVKAVAEALTTPMSLSATVNDAYKKEGSDTIYTTASFKQNFTNLKGEKVDAVSAVLVEGENVNFETEEGVGVKISATDTTYTLGVELNAETNPTGVKVNLTSSTELDDDDQPLVLSVEFIGGTNISVSKNTDGKVEIASEIAEYKGKDAIVIEDEKVGGEGEDKDELTGDKIVTLKISSTDKVLSQSTDGLKANLSIRYNSEAVSGEAEGFGKANHIELLGKDGKAFASFDASAFVKDSFLKNAEFVSITNENPVEGLETGDYIKFTFVTVDTDGKPATETSVEQTFYVPVTTFVKKGKITYTPAEGETAHSLDATTTNGTLADVKEVVDAITDYTKGAIEELDSTVTAAATVEVEVDGVKTKVTPENTVDVITSITQADGKLSTVGSANVATTTYVDNAVTAATGELELTNDENGYLFDVVEEEGVEKDGFVKASDLAKILNDAWAWGTI